MVPIVEIDKQGLLPNEDSRSASNPREGEHFKHQLNYISSGEMIVINWSLLGDAIPNNLTIDGKGLISGRMLIFDEQPIITNNAPTEPTKLDGSNWLSNGRYRGSKYVFNFTVRLDYKYPNPALNTGSGTVGGSEDETDPGPPPPKYIEAFTESNINIVMIRNHDVDNYVFVKKYFEAGHTLRIDNDEYTKDHMVDFIMRHPGPFGNIK